jgi:hypothetical protein
MLTMPIDRITILLEKVPDIDFAADEEALDEELDQADEDLQAALEATPAYRELVEALDEFTPEEARELLALAFFGSGDAEDAMEAIEQARAVAEEEALPQLLRLLVLTDAIESGLERLGHRLSQSEAEEEAEEKEEEEEEAERGETGEPIAKPAA